jgi:broad specificity phosphatase PhoE
MKEIYVLRHAEKDDNGVLTQDGKLAARALAAALPQFSVVIASESPRTQTTASLLTESEPRIDVRAGFYSTTQEKSGEISKIAQSQGITFFEAADIYNDGELSQGIRQQAMGLNELIDETLGELAGDSKALIVSHDMTITPAMAFRGQDRESIPFLSGYVIDENGDVMKFAR